MARTLQVLPYNPLATPIRLAGSALLTTTFVWLLAWIGVIALPPRHIVILSLTLVASDIAAPLGWFLCARALSHVAPGYLRMSLLKTPGIRVYIRSDFDEMMFKSLVEIQKSADQKEGLRCNAAPEELYLSARTSKGLKPSHMDKGVVFQDGSGQVYAFSLEWEKVLDVDAVTWGPLGDFLRENKDHIQRCAENRKLLRDFLAP